jgi:hypothetical protein
MTLNLKPVVSPVELSKSGPADANPKWLGDSAECAGKGG